MIVPGVIMLCVMAFFFYASYSIRANIYMHVFCRKETEEKVVAITFDDGPDSIQTPKVLKVLREKGVKACFFCIGSKIKGNEELLRQIVKEGHGIGNHSYSHAACFPLYTSRRMHHDLTACQQELERVAGRPVKWFRPPFGVTNPTIAKAVRRLGYTPVGWNIRTLDTRQEAPEKVLKRIRKRLVPGSVILLHDRLPGSDQLLLQVLELVEEEGFGVVALEKLMKYT